MGLHSSARAHWKEKFLSHQGINTCITSNEMAHNLLRVTGLTSDVTNPYDPTNIDMDAPLGMKGVSGDVASKGAVASLLPGETSSHYLTFDCHRRIKECNVGGDNYECVSCRSLGGGTCIKASTELKTKYNIASNGVCVPLADALQQGLGDSNHFTTVEEAYLQFDQENEEELSTERTFIISGGGSGGVAYLTRKTGCKDSSLVRKDPALINSNPSLEPLLGCTDIVMCGGAGVGLPSHPSTRHPIMRVEDIDFDIAAMASQMHCYCEAGYTEDRNPATLVPFCKRADGGIKEKEEGSGCPVVFYTGDTKGCLCDDSTQVRLEDVASLELVDDTTDYGKSFIEEAKSLMKITERYDNMHSFTTRDACLPKPGVDPRMASMGYSYATSLFGLAPEITAFNGGHLMTGGLLRESAIDSNGNWHSRIEDNEDGKVVLSESVGGVVPYAGTGSIAAHVWNGDTLNDNNLVGAGGGAFNNNPNASMRVVPLPHSNLPGFGIDSMDHSVGIVASQGKIYPECVYTRKGDPHHDDKDRRGATASNEDTSYLKDSSDRDFDFYKDSPLSLLRSTHDSGICATAYVIPSVHRLEKEKPDAKHDMVANKLLPLMHYRPLAKRVAHTPLETIFRHSVLSAMTRQDIAKGKLKHGESVADQFSALSVVNGNYNTLTQILIDYQFPNLNGEGKERTGGISVRGVFNDRDNEELKEIGGLIVQPVTVQGDGMSSTFARFGEKILATNSPKVIDHYKVGPSAGKYKVDEMETRQLFAAPPTAWRIASNEGSFFSGRGLNNGVEGTGMREAEIYSKKLEPEGKPDIFSAVVMSGDGVLMNGVSAPLLRPMEIPACSLPESTWFERRGPVNERGATDSFSNLLDINNAYSSITAGELTAELNATSDLRAGFNTYSPARPYHEPHGNTVAAEAFWIRFLGAALPGLGPLASIAASVVEANNYKPARVDPMLGIVPAKFHVHDDLWQQCKVTEKDGPSFIPPPMALFESLLRVRTISSECFIRPELVPNRFRADWGVSPHTAGHYMNGIYSPPCIREETGQAYGYPCSGALAQYTTIMVPKPVGESSHSSHTRETLKTYIDTQTASLPSNLGEISPQDNLHPGRENIFDKMGALGKKEKCNCTTGLFCPKLHARGRTDAAPITALPSRGNRHSRFALMTTTPKNDVHLLAALLRAQCGDAAILDLVGRTRQNGITFSLMEATKKSWALSARAMVAPNRWEAFRRNIAYTPYSTRHSHHMANILKPSLHRRVQPKLLRATNEAGLGMLHDLASKGKGLEDQGRLPGVPQSDAEILNITKTATVPGFQGARARRILDFLESSQGATASTFNVGSFAPHAEGVKDIVAVYATPMYTGVSTPPATINEGPGKIAVTDVDGGTDMMLTAAGNAYKSGASRLKRKVEVEVEEVAPVSKVDKFRKAAQEFSVPTPEQLSTYDVSNPDAVDAISLYAASKDIPRVMRRIHLIPVNTPYHGGFECGQTAAQAANTRGVEISYADFMKPPLSATKASTSLEGVRIKAPEPFDDLATRGFFSLDPYSLRKFAHHHHYGYEGLMSRRYSSRNRHEKVSDGELKDRFPFICQSDRGTFPPKHDGTIQPLALVDMGILPEAVVGRTLIQ